MATTTMPCVLEAKIGMGEVGRAPCEEVRSWSRGLGLGGAGRGNHSDPPPPHAGVLFASRMWTLFVVSAVASSRPSVWEPQQRISKAGA